jgi:hypothetical protein
MWRRSRMRGMAVLGVSAIALGAATAGISTANSAKQAAAGGTPTTPPPIKLGSAGQSTTAVTKTFSFIGRPGSATATLLNIDSFLINARCNPSGQPLVFGFSGASAADVFGQFVDGTGRLNSYHNTQFTKQNKGVYLYNARADLDTSGIVTFENSSGKVVTVTYGLDNSRTLNKQNVCTVFGSYVAS